MTVTKYIHETHLNFILTKDASGLDAQEVHYLHEFVQFHAYITHEAQTHLCSPDIWAASDTPVCYLVTFATVEAQYTMF